MAMGVIKPCRSAFNSPLHLVRKGFDETGEVKSRLVTDYRALNLITIPETFPALQVLDITDQLSRSRYFSKVDLCSGYMQIRVSESCQHKTAFSSGYETYIFTRMPLGLRSSSHSFNRALRIVLADLLGKILFVFLDDVLIFSDSVPQRLERLEMLFSKLREHNLKLAPKKCNFLMSKMTFLGYQISDQGIEPDPAKTSAMIKFPQPKNVKAIKSFMGMINYYSRHIPKLAEKAKPMYQLLKKGSKFIWTPECTKAFEYFKTCLTSPPLLKFPDFQEPFYLTTDASKTAISAILSQRYSGDLLPVAYASRTLSDPETRYASSETECLAVVWGINYFKTYLKSSSKFTVFSDCQALKWLQQVKSPNSRLLRWKLELQSYDYEIRHIKGKENLVADCLSRYIDSKEVKVINVMTRAKTRLHEQKNSSKSKGEVMNEIRKSKMERVESDQLPVILESDDLKLTNEFKSKLSLVNMNEKDKLKSKGINQKLMMPGKVVHDENQDEYIMITDEESISSEKLGMLLDELKIILETNNVDKLEFDKAKFDGSQQEFELLRSKISEKFKNTKTKFLFRIRTIKLLKDTDEIDGVLNDFHSTIMGGHQGVNRMANRIGQQYKWPGMRKDIQKYVSQCKTCQLSKPHGIVRQPMVITSTNRNVFGTIHIDSVGPLIESKEGYKYIFTFEDELTRYFGAVPLIDHTAISVAKAMIEHVILRFGLPEIIFSDSGSEFVNSLFAKITKTLGIKHHRTSPYHAQSNGLLERSRATLKAILRSQTNNIVTNWPDFLPFAVFVINSSVNRSTKYSPHELLYSYKLLLPSNMTSKPDPVYNYDDYYAELKFKLQTAHQNAREHLMESKLLNKVYYDKNTKVSEYKLGDKVLLTNEARETKLHQPFIGPFEVMAIVSPVNLKIRIKNKDKVVHINRVKKFLEN